MSGFETIIFDKRDGVGYITLNRPHKLNAYNMQMRDDLYDVLGAVKDDDEVRVVIFRGAGEKAFCAGADLSEFLTAPSPIVARQVRWERDIWGRLLGVPQPLIAALHGFVFGSGIEIALFCDIRIAAEDARFGLPETTLGIIPAAGGTQTLPRTIGRGRALEMLLTGQQMTAADAFQSGLVNRVVPRETLMVVAEETARKIASYDQAAVRACKEAVVRGLDMSLASGLKLESQLSAHVSAARRKHHKVKSLIKKERST
ncbi:MAG: enoyl-CoA hydratase/isomerase family protein [Chloroflexi bacterium]|nr:enoyl-CoA hydratase/isomerase family protein [Chloroflexota bacterium]